jgi:hypothetical protein
MPDRLAQADGKRHIKITLETGIRPKVAGQEFDAWRSPTLYQGWLEPLGPEPKLGADVSLITVETVS